MTRHSHATLKFDEIYAYMRTCIIHVHLIKAYPGTLMCHYDSDDPSTLSSYLAGVCHSAVRPSIYLFAFEIVNMCGDVYATIEQP